MAFWWALDDGGLPVELTVTAVGAADAPARGRGEAARRAGPRRHPATRPRWRDVRSRTGGRRLTRWTATRQIRCSARSTDPTRRRLLSAIAAHPATATELAGDLPISRQAVVKHLHTLAQAGLLERERDGRDVRYRVTPEPLSDALTWMAEVAGQWDARLATLQSSLRG